MKKVSEWILEILLLYVVLTGILISVILAYLYPNIFIPILFFSIGIFLIQKISNNKED